MERRALSSLSVAVVIAFTGLIAAIVCFGVLRSTGTVSRGGQFGGAIAGAIASWAVVAEIYFRAQRGSDRYSAVFAEKDRALERMRADAADRAEAQDRLVQQLRTQVLRGSPVPNQDWEPVLDERNKLVLAKPKDWQPIGDMVMMYQMPMSKSTDLFPAQLTVMVEPPPEGADRNSYHQYLRAKFEPDSAVKRPVIETLHIGEPRQPAIKAVTRAYMRVTLRQDYFGPRRTFEYISEAEADHYLLRVAAEMIESSGASFDQGLEGRGRRAQDQRYLANVVLDYLERGRIRHAHDLRIVWDPSIQDYVVEVRANASSDPAADPERVSTPPDQDQVTSKDDPRLATRALEKSADRAGVLQVEEEAVFPVLRALVYCWPSGVTPAAVYQFEFVDDLFDFVDSSEHFSNVISSVRFLV